MMRPNFFLGLFAGFATLGLAACASVDTAQQSEDEEAFLARIDTAQSCFTPREVRGYGAAPDGTSAIERISVDTGLNEEFVLETLGPCPELDHTLRISLSPRSLGRICTGDVEEIVIPSRIANDFDRCPVRVLGRLTPAES